MLDRFITRLDSWGRHVMETFCALLAIFVGNSPVTGEFPTQRPVARSFDVFFDLRLNTWLSKQSRSWWLMCHDNSFQITDCLFNSLLMGYPKLYFNSQTYEIPLKSYGQSCGTNKITLTTAIIQTIWLPTHIYNCQNSITGLLDRGQWFTYKELHGMNGKEIYQCFRWVGNNIPFKNIKYMNIHNWYSRQWNENSVINVLC